MATQKKKTSGKTAYRKSLDFEDSTSDYFIDALNKDRATIGLEPIEFIDRKCLRCNKPFKAQKRVGNFMCRLCRPYTDDKSFDS